MKKTDKTLELLRLLSGLNKGGGTMALRIVTVKTAAPSPVTLVMEGTNLALDPEIFVIPTNFLPLQEGQRFFALPIAGDNITPRWGLLTRL